MANRVHVIFILMYVIFLFLFEFIRGDQEQQFPRIVFVVFLF